MKIQSKIIFVTILTGLLSLGLNAQARWIITNGADSSSQLISGKKYYLKLNDNECYLKYRYKDYGISLGWEKMATHNITFSKEGGGTINCGDKVAIHIESARYLVYGKQKWGINLTWSEKPLYEWEIRNKENQKGSPILTNHLVGLYICQNTGFVVYCDRKGMPVVNLAWFSECPPATCTLFAPPEYQNKPKEDLVKIEQYLLPLYL